MVVLGEETDPFCSREESRAVNVVHEPVGDGVPLPVLLRLWVAVGERVVVPDRVGVRRAVPDGERLAEGVGLVVGVALPEKVGLGLRLTVRLALGGGRGVGEGLRRSEKENTEKGDRHEPPSRPPTPFQTTHLTPAISLTLHGGQNYN